MNYNRWTQNFHYAGIAVIHVLPAVLQNGT